MMEVFPYVLNSLYIVILFLTIVLIVKVLKLLSKINFIADDVKKKLTQTNSVFDAIELVGTTIEKVNNKVYNGIIMKVINMFSKKEG